MLYIHHTIQRQYIYASCGFHSWLFALDRRGNRSTKLYLGTYLASLSMAWREKCAPDFMSVLHYCLM